LKKIADTVSKALHVAAYCLNPVICNTYIFTSNLMEKDSDLFVEDDDGLETASPHPVSDVCE
jgi:hypothetical protein